LSTAWYDQAGVTADQKQIELMRAAGPQRRAAMALRLSDETIALARRAIARVHPDLDKIQLDIEFVRIQYGAELAAKLQSWLAANDRPWRTI
jgi:hypothetical protein